MGCGQITSDTRDLLSTPSRGPYPAKVRIHRYSQAPEHGLHGDLDEQDHLGQFGGHGRHDPLDGHDPPIRCRSAWLGEPRRRNFIRCGNRLTMTQDASGSIASVSRPVRGCSRQGRILQLGSELDSNNIRQPITLNVSSQLQNCLNGCLFFPCIVHPYANPAARDGKDCDEHQEGSQRELERSAFGLGRVVHVAKYSRTSGGEQTSTQHPERFIC